jgi:hypothetical protein
VTALYVITAENNGINPRMRDEKNLTNAETHPYLSQATASMT